MFITWHPHSIAAAVNQTAAWPTCISRILCNRLEAAENAKRMVKRQVILVKMCYFYYSKQK